MGVGVLQQLHLDWSKWISSPSNWWTLPPPVENSPFICLICINKNKRTNKYNSELLREKEEKWLWSSLCKREEGDGNFNLWKGHSVFDKCKPRCVCVRERKGESCRKAKTQMISPWPLA